MLISFMKKSIILGLSLLGIFLFMFSGSVVADDVCQFCTRYAYLNGIDDESWDCANFDGTVARTTFINTVGADDDIDYRVSCVDPEPFSDCQFCTRYADYGGIDSVPWNCTNFENISLRTEFINGYNMDIDYKFSCGNPNLQSRYQFCTRSAGFNGVVDAPWNCANFDGTSIRNDFGTGVVGSWHDAHYKIIDSGSVCGDGVCDPSEEDSCSQDCVSDPFGFCAPDNLIMKLRYENNSHAALWNFGESMFYYSSPTSDELDFGGMYGSSDLVPQTPLYMPTQNLPYWNPATEGYNCSEGFVGSKIRALAGGGDKDGYLCYKDYTGEGIYDFGGMYSSYVTNEVFVNPATGNFSCPQGYFDQQITGGDYGGSLVDANLHFCYKDYTGEGIYDFGGIYGRTGIADPNPLTGTYGCSEGYHSLRTIGGQVGFSGDSDVFYCYRPHKSERLVVNNSATNGYNYGVCSPNGETVDHSSNEVLWLTTDSNSHVSITSDVDYSVPVYFGDELICQYTEGDCSGSSSCVVTLSDSYNAHLAKCNSSLAYDNKICCGLIPFPYWTNMNGDRIGNGQTNSGADLNDYVLLSIGGLNPSDVVTFEIKSKDPGADSEIRTGASAISAIVGSDGFAKGVWKIEQADLDVSGIDLGEIYFTANGLESDLLTVSEIIDDFPTQIEILSPDCGDDFNWTESVTFEVNVIDEDDEVSGTLASEGHFSKNITNGILSFTHNFASTGNIQVTAHVESSRGLVYEKILNIMVVNPLVSGLYSAACIDSPENLARLESSNVTFDASSTRALDCDGTSCTEILPGNSRLRFDWEFSDYETGTSIHHTHGGTGDVVGSYKFTKRFSQKVENGLNWAILSVDVL
jgi:hypothetical protein